MQEIIHALLIIMGFGVVFIALMGWENRTLIQQGKGAYDLRETLANMMSSVLYK